MSVAYRKDIIKNGPKDFDGYLNGRYILSGDDRDQVVRDLDAVAFRDATHSQQAMISGHETYFEFDTASPLVPFGVDAGPEPDVSALTQADLGRAVEALVDAYEDKSAVVSRALSAYDLAALALAEQHKEPDGRTVLVRENGDLRIVGSKRYWISSAGCTCPDFRHLVYGTKYAGSGAESGMCKHSLCRELLRLAQARCTAISSVQGNKTAFADVQAAQLVRSLKALLKLQTDHISIEIAFYRVRLHAGAVTKVLTSPDKKGWGVRALALSRDAAEQLVAALAPLDKTVTINLMLDADDYEVAVFGDGVGAQVRAII
jgi:hypothetical protein